MGWAPGAEGEYAGRRAIAFKKSWKDNALLVVLEAETWLRGAVFCVGKGWEAGLTSEYLSSPPMGTNTYLVPISARHWGEGIAQRSISRRLAGLGELTAPRRFRLLNTQQPNGTRAGRQDRDRGNPERTPKAAWGPQRLLKGLEDQPEPPRVRRALWRLLRMIIGTAQAKAGRYPGTGKLHQTCRKENAKKVHARVTREPREDLFMQLVPGAVLRPGALTRSCPKATWCCHCPPPITGGPAGLEEEAGLRGGARPRLLGADSGPLLGRRQEAHRQARCGLEPGRRGGPDGLARFGEPGLRGA